MKKRVIVLICLIAVLLVGCGKNSSLVGTWDTDAEGKLDFELYSDGTGIAENYSLEWVAENGKLKVTFDVGILGTVADSYSYELSGNILVLTDDEGESTTYTRVK